MVSGVILPVSFVLILILSIGCNICVLPGCRNAFSKSEIRRTENDTNGVNEVEANNETHDRHSNYETINENEMLRNSPIIHTANAEGNASHIQVEPESNPSVNQLYLDAIEDQAYFLRMCKEQLNIIKPITKQYKMANADLRTTIKSSDRKSLPLTDSQTNSKFEVMPKESPSTNNPCSDSSANKDITLRYIDNDGDLNFNEPLVTNEMEYEHCYSVPINNPSTGTYSGYH